MIISRGYSWIKSWKRVNEVVFPSLKRITSRSSHSSGSPRPVYRTLKPASETDNRLATAIGTFFWAWVIYHVINDYDLIIGEYYEPDPTLWTDEELGIPPDDYVPED